MVMGCPGVTVPAKGSGVAVGGIVHVGGGVAGVGIPVAGVADAALGRVGVGVTGLLGRLVADGVPVGVGDEVGVAEAVELAVGVAVGGVPVTVGPGVSVAGGGPVTRKDRV
jgi:hypothetical protein